MRFFPSRRSSLPLASSLGVVLGTVLVAAGFAAPSAQSQTKTAPSPAKGAASSPAKASADAVALGEFPLEAGDVLAVVVANHSEMSGQLPITEAGKISLPILGNMTVAGKTIAQAEKQILAAIDTQLTNPQVTVTLVRARPRQVLMVGALRGAGPLNLRSNWRVSEAIDAAGGLAGEPDDLIVTLVRGNAQPQRIDLLKIVDSPGAAANLTLRPNDILRFNLLPGRSVAVAGDVKVPGTVVLRRSTRLLDALVAAGGLIQKAENSKITLVRGTRTLEVDAVAATSARNSAANVPLQNGDLLTVEAIRTQVLVVALQDQVKNAGNFNLEGEARVLQAVLAAGLTVKPAQVDISIRRGAERIPINLERAAIDPSADIALRNGDMLLFTPPPGPAVRVTGSVGQPGAFTLKQDATLLDALFQSGNLSTKPDQVKLNILRQTNGRQMVLSVDPVSLISLRDLGQNVRMLEGDLVMVTPVETNTVFLSGEVKLPAAYEVNEDDGLVELLLRAGGPTEFAALKQVQIKHRDNTSVTVDVSQATKPGAPRQLIPLQVGDLVTVPRNLNQVLIMNAVQRPGYYPIPETGTLTIGNALLLAVPRDRAKLQSVAIVRRGPNGEMKSEIVPVNSLTDSKTAGNKLPMNTVLQPGDIVYVPEGSTRAPLTQSALGTLSSLTVLRQLFGF